VGCSSAHLSARHCSFGAGCSFGRNLAHAQNRLVGIYLVATRYCSAREAV
jgi:hypothetical protein